jgi:hypothetical protein
MEPRQPASSSSNTSASVSRARRTGLVPAPQQRARVTNDPAFLPREGSRLGTRANGWRAQERRRRDLIATLVNALGGRDAISDLALIAVKRAVVCRRAGARRHPDKLFHRSKRPRNAVPA